MSSKTAPPLPLCLDEFNLSNEQITRRTIEQIFQDVFNDITLVENLKSAAGSKAVRRHQFLLMGTKGNV